MKSWHKNKSPIKLTDRVASVRNGQKGVFAADSAVAALAVVDTELRRKIAVHDLTFFSLFDCPQHL